MWLSWVIPSRYYLLKTLLKNMKMMKMIPFNIDVRAVSHSCDVLHGSSLLRSPWLEPIVYWAVILVFDLYSRAREVCGVCYNCAMCCWECLVCGIKLCAFCSDEPHCTAVQCTAVFGWPVCTALIVHYINCALPHAFAEMSWCLFCNCLFPEGSNL